VARLVVAGLVVAGVPVTPATRSRLAVEFRPHREGAELALPHAQGEVRLDRGFAAHALPRGRCGCADIGASTPVHGLRRCSRSHLLATRGNAESGEAARGGSRRARVRSMDDGTVAILVPTLSWTLREREDLSPLPAEARRTVAAESMRWQELSARAASAEAAAYPVPIRRVERWNGLEHVIEARTGAPPESRTACWRFTA
jgi:hypothetical protein